MIRTAIARVSLAVVLSTTIGDSPQYEGQYRTDLDYDGRFTFVRLRWGSDFGFSRRGFRSAWNHDYPRAEQHLSLIGAATGRTPVTARRPWPRHSRDSEHH